MAPDPSKLLLLGAVAPCLLLGSCGAAGGSAALQARLPALSQRCFLGLLRTTVASKNTRGGLQNWLKSKARISQ